MPQKVENQQERKPIFPGITKKKVIIFDKNPIFAIIKMANGGYLQVKKCERYGKKIKMGKYCYWCGKYKGL